MGIKKLFQNREPKDQTPVNPHRKVKSPWLIEEISNGLKAKNVKVIGGVVVASNKKVGVQYFEFDRIYGRGAFNSEGYLRVMDMFDELQEVTPKSIGYIFKDSIYLNYQNKGILKRNNKSGKEDFYSEESLRNENIANYLQLDDCNQDSTYEEEDTDREDLHNQNSELQRITD